MKTRLMELQPDLNTDGLVDLQVSFKAYLKDLTDDPELEYYRYTLFYRAITEVEAHNSYSINKDILIFILDLITGDCVYDEFDYCDIDLRDMSDEECYQNAVKAFGIYNKMIIDARISADPLIFYANVTFDENTNQIENIDIVRDETFKDFNVYLSTHVKNYYAYQP